VGVENGQSRVATGVCVAERVDSEQNATSLKEAHAPGLVSIRGPRCLKIILLVVSLKTLKL